jgi:hypothetical protein
MRSIMPLMSLAEVSEADATFTENIAAKDMGYFNPFGGDGYGNKYVGRRAPTMLRFDVNFVLHHSH